MSLLDEEAYGDGDDFLDRFGSDTPSLEQIRDLQVATQHPAATLQETSLAHLMLCRACPVRGLTVSFCHAHHADGWLTRWCAAALRSADAFCFCVAHFPLVPGVPVRLRWRQCCCAG